MEKNYYLKIGFLMLIPILVFLPVFYTHYFYTDEVLQLWLYRKGSDFAMFVPQGRLLNDLLFRYLFSHIDVIDQLAWLRIFSLVCWLICLPAWYIIFYRVSKEEGLPRQLPFFSVLFLVSSLPFGISIQWAACMELSIAYTCGLLAGYLIYRYHKRGWLPALLPGLVSLFFYQNGFGCYLLPLFLQLVARRKADRKMLESLFFYFLVYLIYFLLFKGLTKTIIPVGLSERAAFTTNPFAKVYYLFFQILPGAFHFNVVFIEKSILGHIIFVLITGGCLLFDFSRISGLRARLFYVGMIFGGFALIYLPSMIIRENFASGRTLLGVDMAVFLWVFATLMRVLPTLRLQSAISIGVGVLCVATAVYNFRGLFLPPAVHEYVALKTFIDKNFGPEIRSVDYIRGGEEDVRQQYGVQSSWDEYGMYSSYFAWVPDALTRQLVFEKTGDRALAGKLIITVWPDQQAWQTSRKQQTKGDLLIDAPAILRK